MENLEQLQETQDRKFVSKYELNEQTKQKSNKLLIYTYFLLLTLSTILTAALGYVHASVQTNVPEIAQVTKVEKNETQDILGVQASEGIIHEYRSSISSEVESDSRLEAALEKLFTKYSSPLTGHASYIISEGNRIGVDPKLFVAIAGMESGFCKNIPYYNGVSSYNCHGWKQTNTKFRSFGSFKEGITFIMEGFRKAYGASNLDISGIQSSYCPDCSGSKQWSNAVSTFILEINYLYNNL